MTAPTYLPAEDRARVGEAVSRAEADTAGEIVTILADRSDGYTDVALSWAVLASFAAMTIFALFPEPYLARLDWLLGRWHQEWTLHQVLAVSLGFGVVKFIGVMLIQAIQPVKFFLIPPPIRTARVHERAVRAFRIGAERRTHGRTGILIYLSMREHRAEIVADEAIATKVDPEVWGDAMDAMLAELKQGRVADGMIAAVTRVGKVLAEHFPRPENDVNELPDRLIEV
ncbi:MAG: TPM domain-containing protein [Novosphingobium sp.]|nr:TPM domain-containing protein [Novosphingobium sp.]MCP5402964.1 TPM domain-containing protein [Novosphingobium sp.]